MRQNSLEKEFYIGTIEDWSLNQKEKSRRRRRFTKQKDYDKIIKKGNSNRILKNIYSKYKDNFEIDRNKIFIELISSGNETFLERNDKMTSVKKMKRLYPDFNIIQIKNEEEFTIFYSRYKWRIKSNYNNKTIYSNVFITKHDLFKLLPNKKMNIMEFIKILAKTEGLYKEYSEVFQEFIRGLSKSTKQEEIELKQVTSKDLAIIKKIKQNRGLSNWHKKQFIDHGRSKIKIYLNQEKNKVSNDNLQDLFLSTSNKVNLFEIRDFYY